MAALSAAESTGVSKLPSPAGPHSALGVSDLRPTQQCPQLYIERRDDADRVESEDPGSNELTRGLQSMIAENQAKMEYLVMTPADAITHIKQATEGLPVKFILPWFAVNGVPDDIIEEHIRLMVTKVGPAIA